MMKKIIVIGGLLAFMFGSVCFASQEYIYVVNMTGHPITFSSHKCKHGSVVSQSIPSGLTIPNGGFFVAEAITSAATWSEYGPNCHFYFTGVNTGAATPSTFNIWEYASLYSEELKSNFNWTGTSTLKETRTEYSRKYDGNHNKVAYTIYNTPGK